MSWAKILESLPEIPKEFEVDGVKFRVAESWIGGGKYTKHLIENIETGKQAKVTHEKLTEYL